MTEQALRQALNETTDFLRRQRLLKQLWKLQQQREVKTEATNSTRKHQLSHPTLRDASRRAGRVVT